MSMNGMDQVRAILKTGSLEGKSLTAAGMAAVLGMESESQKAALRKRLNVLLHRGEAEKTGYGQYRYKSEGPRLHCRGEGYERTWRLIRIQGPGWTRQGIAALARFHGATVGKYMQWLENEGYIARHGRRGNTVLWRTTLKGQEQRAAPLPPVSFPDPYHTERAAVARLCGLMLVGDLDQTSTRQRIGRELELLSGRFSQRCATQNENEKKEG